MASPNLRVTLTDTEWHEVGTPVIQYKIKAICSNPLEMCCTTPGVIPTVDTKAFFSLGGLVNNVKTRPNFQNWIRATVVPSTFIQNDMNDEGFDETSAIRMAIAELQTSTIKVSNRVLSLEKWRAEAIRDWQILKYQLNYRIDRVFKTLSRLIKTDTLIYQQLHELRMRLPKISMRLDNLEVMKVSQSEFHSELDRVLLYLARNTKLDVKIMSKLINLEYDIIKCKEDIDILDNTTGGGALIEIESLTNQMNSLNNNLDLYWSLCIAMVNATSNTQVNAIYNNFINTHQIPNDALPVLQFAHTQALKIVISEVVDTEQTTDIDEINDFLSGTIISESINAATLDNIEE